MSHTTHNKAANIKRSISDLISVTQWSVPLSLTHDNIDHEIDQNLLDVINQLRNRISITTSSSEKKTNNDSDSNSDNNQLTRKKVKSVISSSSNNNSSNKYYSTIGEKSLDEPLTSLKKINQSVLNQINLMNKLEKVFSNVGDIVFNNDNDFDIESSVNSNNSNSIKNINSSNNNNNNDTNDDHIEYNPSLTYRLGKQFVLGHLFVDQMTTLLDFLFLLSLEIESNLEYWERKVGDHSWYLYEKTPLFWFNYHRQQITKLVEFEDRFNKMHNLSKTKSLQLLSTCLSKLNQSLEWIQSKLLFRKVDNNSNVVSNLEHRVKEQQLASKQETDSNNKDKQYILHPIKELDNRMKRLGKFEKITATSIGRLCHILEKSKDFQSVSEFNTVIIQGLILLYDLLLYLNNSFNININQNIIDNNTNNIDQLIQLLSNSNSNNNNNILSNQQLQDVQKSIYKVLNGNLLFAKESSAKIYERVTQDCMPGYFSRNWLKLTIGSVALGISIKYSYDNVDVFKQNLKEYKTALIRFYKDHLEEPLFNIWNVIRYDKKTLSVSDPISLQSSVDSLGRMVVDYAIDHNKSVSSDTQLQEKLVELASRGDISSVMKSYENNIRAPIQNLLFGDLIRLILIQVQKEKVDIDKAMVAIDKLLQANELNFQILAAIPAGIFISLIIWQIKKLLTDPKKTLPYSQTVIFATLRKLHRTLTISNSSDYNNSKQQQSLHASNLIPTTLQQMSPIVTSYFKTVSSANNSRRNSLDSSGSTTNVNDTPLLTSLQQQQQHQQISFEQYGLVLSCTFKLRQHQKSVKGAIENQWFKEDLFDLESDHLQPSDKIITINRMFTTYSFLSKKLGNN